MLTAVSNDDLVQALSGIKRCFTNTPLSLTAERCIAAAYSQGSIITDQDIPTKILRDIISTYSICITPDAQEFLTKTSLFCHDLPLCNAVARKTSTGESFVLIYSGILSMIKYRLSLAILISNIQFMLEKKSNDIVRARQYLSEIVFPAQALSYWYYIDPFPIPEFDGIFCEAHKIQVLHGIGGSLLFVALHELGHIRLGHLDQTCEVAPHILSNYVEENLNNLKIMEFQADQFAFACIKDELRLSFITNFFIVLDLVSDIECFCLPHLETHPYVLNRINNAASIFRLEDDE